MKKLITEIRQFYHKHVRGTVFTVVVISLIIITTFFIGSKLFRSKFYEYIAPLGLADDSLMAERVSGVFISPVLKDSVAIPGIISQLETINSFQQVHAAFTINFHTYYWLCLAFGLTFGVFAACILLYLGKEGWIKLDAKKATYLFICVAFAGIFRAAIEIFEMEENYKQNSAAFFRYGLLFGEIKSYLASGKSPFYTQATADRSGIIPPDEFISYVEEKIREINIQTVNYSPEKITDEITKVNIDGGSSSPD